MRDIEHRHAASREQISRMSLCRHVHRDFHGTCQAVLTAVVKGAFERALYVESKLILCFHASTRARLVLPFMRGM